MNNYPNYYQPNYYQGFNQPVQQPPQSQPQQGIIWVSGETGAKSYLVAPNTTVVLWDSEDEVIYLKAADANGLPSIKTLDYKVREHQKPKDNTEYVTRDELSNIEREINYLKNKLNGLNTEGGDDE